MSLSTDPLQAALSLLDYSDQPGTIASFSEHPGARDFVWQELRQRCKVDAAYFRGAVPLVAFFHTDSREETERAQQRLWNFGRVPILIAASTDELRALSCTQAPTAAGIDGTTLAVSSGRADMHVLEAFRRRNVERGRPMIEYGARLGSANRVDARLLRNLRDLQERLLSAGVPDEIVERLIGRSIFVRFLEDRQILSSGQLGELVPCESFLDVLRSEPNQLDKLFEGLAEHFNGDAFTPDWPRNSISDDAMAHMADFLSGGSVATGQQSLWPYDFSIIPTDLVSGIYEQLLHKTQRKTAAYYTPRRLVDLVLDEVLPAIKADSPIRILDPACGSGVFLSEAFKRLVYRRTKEVPLSYQQLGALLTESLFGMDISTTAIGVASFGLHLTLLDHADPPTAWRDARLPNLVGQNLFAADFFADHPLSDLSFDRVVGNPPWQSSLSRPARDFVRSAEPAITIPDNQIATAFLWRARQHLAPDGTIGMVMPAKALLHNRTSQAVAARNEMFSRMSTRTVFDLSPLRGELFGSASAPAAVIIADRDPTSAPAPTVLALSPRASPLSRMAEGLVFSKEDIHVVPLTLAKSVPDLWKTLLWGTLSDVDFIQSLRERHPTLEGVASERGWTVGQGFQVRGGGRHSAEHLAGMPVVPARAIHALRVAPHDLVEVSEDIMHRPRPLEVYLGPHVLLRKGFSSVPLSAFLSSDAAHPDSIFGICGARQEEDSLRAVAAILNSSLAHYYYFMTSSSWGVEREQLQLAEYLTFPMADITEQALLDELGQVEEQAANGAPPSQWKGHLDDIVYRAYDLDKAEQELVSDGLSLRLTQYADPTGSSAFNPIDSNGLESYRDALESALRLYLPSLSVGVVTSSLEVDLIAATCLLLGTDQEADNWSADELVQFIGSARASSEPMTSYASIVEPVAIVMIGPRVHIVKPNERRFWSRSGARQDARSIIAAVLRPGIDDDTLARAK